MLHIVLVGAAIGAVAGAIVETLFNPVKGLNSGVDLNSNLTNNKEADIEEANLNESVEKPISSVSASQPDSNLPVGIVEKPQDPELTEE